ncbi:hypothetical protein FM112_06285 [Gulosibacter sp. 10]|nr:hypothetical protein FM112_06285 [Gulosibacter sp. 10]
MWETFETNPQFWIIGAIVVLIFAGLVIRVLSRNRLNKKRGKR